MNTAKRGCRPRICFLTETFHPEIGGGETQTRLLSSHLVRRGWQVEILTRRSRSTSLPEERIDGVRVCRLPPSGPGRARKWAVAATAGRALRRRRVTWDIVCVSGFRILGLPAVRAARRLGRRCILKADSNGEMSGEYFRSGLALLGLSPSRRPVAWLLEQRDRRLREADAFVAISSTIASEFSQAGVAPERIVRIPNAVDTVRFSPASSEEKARLRAELGQPASGFVITYAGRFVRYKGLAVLVDAFESMRPDEVDARLVLVGSGGADIHNCEAELRERARGLASRGRVLFTGPVDDVERYLRASDAFVFPTEEEAFGLSLVEAMACGLPCVSTHVGGIPEIGGGGAALLVAPRDREGLKAAMLSLLRRPGLRERLGRLARRRAVAFSVDAVADAYGDLFLRLAAGRSAIPERTPRFPDWTRQNNPLGHP